MRSDPIDDDPRERTLGQIVEDDNIETKVIVNIHAESPAYKGAHIVAVSYNGYVLLAGQVSSEALKSGATDVVRKIPAVRRIYNELTVSKPTGAMTRTNDTWITTKVKSALLGSTAFDGMRVKVLTENGVVYLMGRATRKEADQISATAAGISGVDRVVRLFELIELTEQA